MGRPGRTAAGTRQTSRWVVVAASGAASWRWECLSGRVEGFLGYVLADYSHFLRLLGEAARAAMRYPLWLRDGPSSSACAAGAWTDGRWERVVRWLDGWMIWRWFIATTKRVRKALGVGRALGWFPGRDELVKIVPGTVGWVKAL